MKYILISLIAAVVSLVTYAANYINGTNPENLPPLQTETEIFGSDAGMLDGGLDAPVPEDADDKPMFEPGKRNKSILDEVDFKSDDPLEGIKDQV